MLDMGSGVGQQVLTLAKGSTQARQFLSGAETAA